MKRRKALSLAQRQNRLQVEQLEDRRMLAVLPADPTEFQVNTFRTDRDAYQSDIALAKDGRHVVVWNHRYSDTDYDVRYRTYNGNNEPQSSDTSVAFTGFREHEARVSIAENGNFVVVYTLVDAGGDSDVFFRLFNFSGATLASGQVNTNDGGIYQGKPDVDMADNGSFVVVYQDGLDINSGIRFRSYSAAGIPHQATDQEILGGSSSFDREYNPVVALNNSGTRFVAAWEEQDFNGTTNNDNWEISWAVYDYSSADNRFDIVVIPPSTVYLYSYGTTDVDYQNPSIGMDNNGNFVLAFDKYDGNRYEVLYGRYFSNGTTRNAPVSISGLEGVNPGLYYGTYVGVPSVGVAGDGSFVVSWAGDYFGLEGADDVDIYFREYNSNNNNVTYNYGAPNTTRKWGVVNANTAGTQFSPEVAKSNNFVFFTFEDVASPGTIQMRTFWDPIRITGNHYEVVGLITNDIFELERVGNNYAITVNGFRQIFPTSQINTIEFRGRSGTDFYKFDADGLLPFTTITDNFAGGKNRIDLSATTTIGVNINIATNVARNINANLRLKLSSNSTISDVIGTQQNDAIFGNHLDNFLRGMEGNDNLTGRAGNDRLRGDNGNDMYIFDADTQLGIDTVENGGGGIDLANFGRTSSLGVVFDMQSAALQVLNANLSLQLLVPNGLENVIGTAADDRIFGNNMSNRIDGRAGNDVLVGNNGNDFLFGGDGRDLIIGGNGTDRLRGGTLDDIMIGGRTNYDTNISALNAIMAEWTRPIAYTSRVGHLLGTNTNGAANGNTLLNAASVLNDGSIADVLLGNTEQDWFFRDLNDVVKDRINSETITPA